MTTDAWTRSAAQSSDEATFDALFLTHYQPIFRLLYRIAGTREEAEDLAQETFLRLHRSPELWKGLHVCSERYELHFHREWHEIPEPERPIALVAARKGLRASFQVDDTESAVTEAYLLVE
jgi:hypothetical protein